MSEKQCIKCENMCDCYSCESCLNQVCDDCINRFKFVASTDYELYTYLFCDNCMDQANRGEIEPNDILSYLVKCDHCSRIWDGNAQCDCEVIHSYDIDAGVDSDSDRHSTDGGDNDYDVSD